MRQGEPERKLKGKKRAFGDSNRDSAADMGVMKAQLRIVDDKIDKKARYVYMYIFIYV
jgi:hypothetical protein